MVIPGYTRDVKTAISLPDDTYEQAARQAAELGISRSEFFARAARSYLLELASHSLTQQINEVRLWPGVFAGDDYAVPGIQGLPSAARMRASSQLMP